MKKNLLSWVSSQVQAMNALLLRHGYPNLDRKKLMSVNGWKTLPVEVQEPLFKRDAFQQVANFIEHTPDYMEVAGATDLEKLEYLGLSFMDDYLVWLKENAGTFQVDQLVDSFTSAKGKSEIQEKEDSLFFTNMTLMLINRYAQKHLQKSDPAPNAPEVA